MKLLLIVWMTVTIIESFFMNAPLNLGEQAILPPIRTNATHAVYFYDGIFRYEPLHPNVEQAPTKTTIRQSIEQIVSTSTPVNSFTISTLSIAFNNVTNETKKNIDDRTTKSSFNKEDIMSEKQFSLESGPTQFSNDGIIRSEEMTVLITPPTEQEILKPDETTIAVDGRTTTEANMRGSLTATTPTQPHTTVIKTERTFMQQEQSETRMTTQQPLVLERNSFLFSKEYSNVSIMTTGSNEEAIESSTHVGGVINRENTEWFAPNSGIVTWMRTTTSANGKTTAVDRTSTGVLVSANNNTKGTTTSTYTMITATERVPAEATIFVGYRATEVATFTDKPTTQGILRDATVSVDNRKTESISAGNRTTGIEKSPTETTPPIGNEVTNTATFADKTATVTAAEAIVSADNRRTETMFADSTTTATVKASTEATVLVGSGMMENATFADRPATVRTTETIVPSNNKRIETMSADRTTTETVRASTEATVLVGSDRIESTTFADRPATVRATEAIVSTDNRRTETTSADRTTTATVRTTEAIAPANNRRIETMSADNRRIETMSADRTTIETVRASTEATVLVGSEMMETATFADRSATVRATEAIAPANNRRIETMSADSTTTATVRASTEATVLVGSEMMETATFADRSATVRATEAIAPANNRRIETMSADSTTTATVRASTEATVLVSNEMMENATFADRPATVRTTEAIAPSNNKRIETMSADRTTTETVRASTEATVLVGSDRIESTTFADRPATVRATEAIVSTDNRRTETTSADRTTTATVRASTEATVLVGSDRIESTTFADRSATVRATEAITSAGNRRIETMSAHSTTTATVSALTEATVLVGNGVMETATFADRPATVRTTEAIAPANNRRIETMSADNRRIETMSADRTTTETVRASTEATVLVGSEMMETATFADRSATVRATEAIAPANNRRIETMSADRTTTETVRASTEATVLVGSEMMETATFADRSATVRATEAIAPANNRRIETMSADRTTTATVRASKEAAVLVGSDRIESAAFADKPPTVRTTEATVSADNKAIATDRTLREATALVDNMATEAVMFTERPLAERISTNDAKVSVDIRTTTIEHTLKGAMMSAQNQTIGTEKSTANFDLETLNPINSMRNMETTQPTTTYSNYEVTELNENNQLTNDITPAGWHDRSYNNMEASKGFENETRISVHPIPGVINDIPTIRTTRFRFVATDADNSSEAMAIRLRQNDDVRLRRTNIESILTQIVPPGNRSTSIIDD